MSNLKFRYTIVKHPTDYAIHEAYANLDSKIIAINGEPVSLYGYSQAELMDMINAISKDTKDSIPVDGYCEDLYEAFDNISTGNYDSYSLPPRQGTNVIPLRK